MNAKTLTEREKYVLAALSGDPDPITTRRAKILLRWSQGAPKAALAEESKVRPAQVEKFLRAFAEKRLEVFAPAALERASRGSAGRTSIDALLRKYKVSLGHVRHVQELAGQLFEETRAAHGLPDDCLRLLKAGALIHNIGFQTDDDKHHKVGRDILLTHTLEGFTDRDRDIIACLTLFNRKKTKVAADPIFAGLDEPTQQATLRMSALLRVADALDFSRTQSTSISTVHLNALVEAIVEGPHAQADAERANKRADLWRQVIAPPFHARLPDDLAPKSGAKKHGKKAKPAVRSGEPITRSGIRIVGVQFRRIIDLEDVVRQSQSASVECVHDMRVAVRRLRSALRLLRPYYPKKRLAQISKPLRPLARRLGAVRDLDVLLENLRTYTATLGLEQQRKLDPLLAEWEAGRADAHRKLVTFLESDKYERWVAQMDDFVDAKEKGGTPRVGDVVPALIWKHYGKLRSYETRVEDASFATLHRLRIQTKRVRYALEFFIDAMGNEAPLLLEPLVALQDRLGELHDAAVASQNVTDFIAGQALEAQQGSPDSAHLEGIAAYLSHLQRQMVQLELSFYEGWEAVIKPAYRMELAKALATI